MPTLAAATFHLLDWAVLGGYFALLLVTGVLFSRREAKTSGEYFLAGRQMPVWAVAISVLATSLSAATFIGGPQQAYDGDLTYLSANIGAVLAVLIVAIFFIPAFYRANVATVYELLDHRFGPAAKRAASAMFMLGRLFASGARVFIVAIPASRIIFGDTLPGHLILAIAILSAVAVAYTLVGGIRSVIWTDCIQAAVFVGAAIIAGALLLHRIPLPLSDLVAELAKARSPAGTSKLSVIPLGLDPSLKYTLLTAVFGFSLLNLGAYGTDHDLVQRMLTCRSSLRGSWSAIAGVLIGIPVSTLFLVIGLLLYVFYARPDLMGAAAPTYERPPGPEIFLGFILNEMPRGMSGVMMAGLFAAGLGSLVSVMNALAATFINDFYRPLRPGRSEKHYLAASRLGVVGWAVVLGLFACVCVYWQAAAAETGQTLIDFALSVMTFAYAGLVAVFLTAIFTRRGNTTSAIAALLTGLAVVVLLQPGVFPRWAGLISWTHDTPTGATQWSLADLKLAFPWHLLIGASLAFTVCCAGSPRRPRKPGPPRTRRSRRENADREE